MDSEKLRRKELLTCLGAGILIEGIIFFAMLYISSFKRALEMFLLILLISAFLGILAYTASLGRGNKNRKISEQS